jgi:acyl-CoA thioesterase YciA
LCSFPKNQSETSECGSVHTSAGQKPRWLTQSGDRSAPVLPRHWTSSSCGRTNRVILSLDCDRTMSRPIHVPRDSTRMLETQSQDFETLTHRLVLPRDANHHGTLYAGTLLALALEAGYATAFRAAGLNANLVLKRVLDLRCYEPVPVGQVVQIRGRQIHRGSAQIVVALWGTPLPDRSAPWMDGVMQFVQVDESGRPEPLEEEPDDQPIIVDPPWSGLQERTRKLLRVRQ